MGNKPAKEKINTSDFNQERSIIVLESNLKSSYSSNLFDVKPNQETQDQSEIQILTDIDERIQNQLKHYLNDQMNFQQGVNERLSKLQEQLQEFIEESKNLRRDDQDNIENQLKTEFDYQINELKSNYNQQYNNSLDFIQENERTYSSRIEFIEREMSQHYPKLSLLGQYNQFREQSSIKEVSDISKFLEFYPNKSDNQSLDPSNDQKENLSQSSKVSKIRTSIVKHQIRKSERILNSSSSKEGSRLNTPVKFIRKEASKRK